MYIRIFNYHLSLIHDKKLTQYKKKLKKIAKESQQANEELELILATKPKGDK